MPTLQWKKIVSKNAYVSKLQLNAEAKLESEEELNFQYLKGRKSKGNYHSISDLLSQSSGCSLSVQGKVCPNWGLKDYSPIKVQKPGSYRV